MGKTLAPKITINLILLSRREPELYAGIEAIPEVCRSEVIRSLLEIAIRTPYNAMAIGARAASLAIGSRASALMNATKPDSEAQIIKKLTFSADQPDDAQLYAHFDGIAPGRRRQTARSLLMKGLLTQDLEQ